MSWCKVEVLRAAVVRRLIISGRLPWSVRVVRLGVALGRWISERGVRARDRRRPLSTAAAGTQGHRQQCDTAARGSNDVIDRPAAQALSG
jgi:hypothetical protein